MKLAKEAGFDVSDGHITQHGMESDLILNGMLIKFADEYHAELAQVSAMPDGWISVGDKLPTEGAIVVILVVSWGDKAYTGYLEGGDWYDADGNFIGRGFNSVTHWMLLPALPKLEKIGES